MPCPQLRSVYGEFKMSNVYNVKTVTSALIAGTFLSIYLVIFSGALTWIVATTLNLGTVGVAVVGAVVAVPSIMGIVAVYRMAFAAETSADRG